MLSFPILVSLVTYPLIHVLSVLFHQRAAKRKVVVQSHTGNPLASREAVQPHSTVLEESLYSIRPSQRAFLKCKSWKTLIPLTLIPPAISIRPVSVATTNQDTPGSGGAIIKRQDSHRPGATTVSVVNLSMPLGIILISPVEVGRSSRCGSTISSLGSWTIKRRKQGCMLAHTHCFLLLCCLHRVSSCLKLLLLWLLLQQQTVP